VITAVLVGGFVGTYLLLFGGSSAAPLALSSAPPAAAAASAGAAASATGLAGSWKASSGSVAGYRVREQLAFLPAPSDAVGRTSAVTGTVVVGGTTDALTVTSASLTVDVSTLTSDQQMRDQHIHQMGLESDTYPKATFVLSDPITLPANAASGAAVSVQATGKLTIHGTTQTVTIPLTARLSSNSIEIAGSTTFPFERFGMTPPSIGGFVSVQDSATMEFDIHLKQG
jgi:polyisoprenoid-binding protein YceI